MVSVVSFAPSGLLDRRSLQELGSSRPSRRLSAIINYEIHTTTVFFSSAGAVIDIARRTEIYNAVAFGSVVGCAARNRTNHQLVAGNMRGWLDSRHGGPFDATFATQ